MNEAHLHMVVNHFPIIGTILGLGILITGIVLKNNTIKNTAYSLFVVAAIFAAISMATGEGAEHMVKDFPEVGRKIIHEHEEMAEKLAIVLYLLGVLSLVGFYINLKSNPKGKLMSFVVATVAAVAVFLSVQTGTSGGEVRHTEIRADYKPGTTMQQNTKTTGETHEDED